MNKPAKLQPSQLTMILTLSAAFSVMCAAFPFTLEQLIGTAISIGGNCMFSSDFHRAANFTLHSGISFDSPNRQPCSPLQGTSIPTAVLLLLFAACWRSLCGATLECFWQSFPAGTQRPTCSSPDCWNLFLYVYTGHSDACTQQHADFWRSPAHAGSHALRRIPFDSPAKPRLFAG